MVVTWLVTIPALVVQRLRNRAARLARMALAQRRAALTAQLDAIRARTNPHFFFNTINTIAGLIPEDPQLAERTLERLADLFRYALESDRYKTVRLAREIEMVRDYLAIQTTRFGERLVIDVALDPAAADVEVPPLLLQPIVENAILHGLGTRPRGRVEVTVRREGDRVVVDVIDDGPGPGGSSHRGTQHSVQDLRERVVLLWGERGAFDLTAAPGGGCLARLMLPADTASP
jgi:two-component system sensor histidine kinase AlgZ